MYCVKATDGDSPSVRTKPASFEDQYAAAAVVFLPGAAAGHMSKDDRKAFSFFCMVCKRAQSAWCRMKDAGQTQEVACNKVFTHF